MINDMLGKEPSVPITSSKHQLRCRWTLWYCRPEPNKVFSECLVKIASFGTVEDFWSLYCQVQSPGGLSDGSDYYLFKDGIYPMWEDSVNVNGGRWIIYAPKDSDYVDHLWVELCMTMLGEQFDNFMDEICGAVVNVRNKTDKVSLWTRNATNDEAIGQLGKLLKTKLNVDQTIHYEVHKSAQQRPYSKIQFKMSL